MMICLLIMLLNDRIRGRGYSHSYQTTVRDGVNCHICSSLQHLTLGHRKKDVNRQTSWLDKAAMPLFV